MGGDEPARFFVDENDLALGRSLALLQLSISESASVAEAGAGAAHAHRRSQGPDATVWAVEASVAWVRSLH